MFSQCPCGGPQLRLNEFGIYELATEEEPSPASAASVVAADGSTAPPVVSTDVTQLVAVPVKVESSTESAAAATAAIPSASQGQGTETNNATKAAVEPSTTPSTNTTTNNTSSNGERERWKQRFPSTTKVQVDIVCCKQCDGKAIHNFISFRLLDLTYCVITQAMGSPMSSLMPITVRRSVVSLAQPVRHI